MDGRRIRKKVVLKWVIITNNVIYGSFTKKG